MLYFIKSGDCSKIGFTENIDARLNSYTTNNPFISLIGVKEGGRAEEKEYHKKYKKYALKRSEWMRLPVEIFDELKKEFCDIRTFEEQCEDLKNDGFTDRQIDFLKICIKFSKEPIQKRPYNYFRRDEEFTNAVMKELNISENEIEKLFEELKVDYVVFKYGNEYIVNPNYLYYGNAIYKRELKIGVMITLDFDFDSDLKEGVICSIIRRDNKK